MPKLLLDLRQALRGLLKTPAFTITAVLTLALGIGANTAIFSLVDRVLLRPLPLPDSQRLMVVTEFRDPGYDNLSWPDYVDLSKEARSFTGVTGFMGSSAILTGDGEPERLRAAKVTWNFFQVVGVAPLLGRGLLEAEGDMNGPEAAVLSHGLWTRRFGADPAILNKSLRLDGKDVVVVGVMPPGFEVPYQLRGSDLYLPLRLSAGQQAARGNHFLPALGRLRPDVSPAAAREEVRGLISALGQSYPDTNYKYQGKVVPLQEEVTGKVRPTLLVLLGATAFVLLIACANVANLLLARGGARTREMCIRAALGAGRGQLVGQLLTEGAVLALLGAGAGLVVAQLALAGLLQIMPAGPAITPGLDARMLLFSFTLALGSVLLFALIPAWQISRPDLTEGLRDGAKGSAGVGQRRLRQALVAAEVALATSLLAGAGLMVRSLWSLQQVDPGFRSEGVLTAGLTLPKAKYPDGATQRAFLDRLVARTAQIPGVRGAAAVDLLPLGGSSRSSTYTVDGQPPSNESPSVEQHEISPGFFDALGIPLLRGRVFAPGEGDVAVVTAAFGARHWPGEDPVGHRFSFNGSEGPWISIIGVAGDVRTQDLSRAPEPQVFLPLLNPQAGSVGFITLVGRGTAAPETLVPGFKAALRELDPDLPLSRIQPLEAVLAKEREASRAKGLLFATFGAVALLLSAVGIYGVTSTLVAQRTQEIGVRMALGAQVKDVLLLVIRQGLNPLALGLGAGLLAAVTLARLIQGQLYGVTPLDPGTYSVVLLVLAAAGLLSTLFPALRAARVDPAVALRSE
ncbi:MAG TPA: ABC transporter permease [Holophagaceae bacterium]|nr:ABC transporter permease [Holophagaceae bacterium]